MTVEEVAMGFIRVANESMCRPIRALTQVYIILTSNWCIHILNLRFSIIKFQLIKTYMIIFIFIYRQEDMIHGNIHWPVLEELVDNILVLLHVL